MKEKDTINITQCNNEGNINIDTLIMQPISNSNNTNSNINYGVVNSTMLPAQLINNNNSNNNTNNNATEKQIITIRTIFIILLLLIIVFLLIAILYFSLDESQKNFLFSLIKSFLVFFLQSLYKIV